jgi:acetyl-CoA acetyltransferase
MEDVFVIGAGMTRFAKSDRSLRDLAGEAVSQAVEDAGVEVSDLAAAYVGNGVAGLVTGQEMIRGQVMLRPLGIEGIPIFNIENACASASSALHLGWQTIATGMHDYVLCLGAEKLTHEDKTVGMKAIGTAVDVERMAEMAAEIALELGDDVPVGGSRSFFMDIYADMSRSYMRASGATAEHFAKVVVKNQHNGARNPRAQYGKEMTVEDVLASRMIVDPLTLLMCSPISDGAAAVVLASKKGMDRVNGRGPRIRASVVLSGNTHDKNADPQGGSAGRAAKLAYEAAGLGPEDLDCAEVHDASAPAELICYEQIGLAEPGGGPDLIDSGRTFLDGDLPVNTSGGLLCKGHPIGATGIAQICESTWQLRGDAGDRQVEGARVALCQNGGGWLDGDSAAMAVHILSKD